MIGTRQFGSHLHQVDFALESGQTWSAPPGSYLEVLVGGVILRAYTIVDADQNTGSILVSTSKGGVGSRFIGDLKPGDVFTGLGPFADLQYQPGTGKPKLFVATGSGVAPFKRMVDLALAENLPATLVLGVATESDLPFNEHFKQLVQRNKSFTYEPVLSRPQKGWSGSTGHVTDVLIANQQILRSYDVYVCGLAAMIYDVKKLLRTIQQPREQVFVESFG